MVMIDIWKKFLVIKSRPKFALEAEFEPTIV